MKLLTLLFPEMSEITNVPQVGYSTNSILFKSILLYGPQGRGKTEMVRTIVEKAVQKYGEENVNAVSVVKGTYLPQLMAKGLNDKLVQILFVDNATLTKVTDKVWQDFFMIRHIWYEKTKRNHGYILVVIAAHRFHGVSLSLRADNDAIIFLDVPSNPYDESIIKRFIGQEGIDMIRKQKTNLVWTKTFIEPITFPMATKNYIKEIIGNEILSKFYQKWGYTQT